MNFKDIIKNGIENKDVITRYVVKKIEGMANPVLIALQTNDKHDLYIKMYETDYFSLKDKPKEYLENPFNHTYIINYLLYGFIMDDQNPDSPRPVCELDASIWRSGVTINKIFTRVDMRRKGLASYAVNLAQDYYTRNPDCKGKTSQIMYTHRTFGETEDLKFKTKFEHNSGAFGEILSNIKSKILKRDAESVCLEFLNKNHFICEKHPYQIPHRMMRSRDLLDDQIINDESSTNYVQIYDTVLDFDPKCAIDDYSKN